MKREDGCGEHTWRKAMGCESCSKTSILEVRPAKAFKGKKYYMKKTKA